MLSCVHVPLLPLRVRDNHTLTPSQVSFPPHANHLLVVEVHPHTPSTEEQRQEDLQLEASQRAIRQDFALKT